MRGQFLDISDKRWAEALARGPHDVYHTPEYVAVAAKYENALPTAFYIEHSGAACLVPLLIRQLPEYFEAPPEWRDAASPYGYPGPLIIGAVDRQTRCSMLEMMINDWKASGLISAFIRSHPLLPPVDEDGVWPGVAKIKAGETVYVDLTQDSSCIRRGMRENHRRQIERLRSEGFTVALDDWGLLDQFVELYSETMQRRNAETFYHFPGAYFCDLHGVLGRRLHLLSVISPEGGVAAAGLFTETDGIVQFHLGCSAAKYLAKAPSKLVLHRAQEWAKAEGNRILHLGGGRGCAADSLFQFKAGFSELRARFYTYGAVLNDERYELLVRKTGAATGKAAAPVTGFFPAYRAERPAVGARSPHTSALPTQVA